jgi:hypothetical protein
MRKTTRDQATPVCFSAGRFCGKTLALLLEKRTARPREALVQAPKIPPSFAHLPRTSTNGPCATEDSEGRPVNIFVVSLAPQCSYEARVQAVLVCAVGNARTMSLSSSNSAPPKLDLVSQGEAYDQNVGAVRLILDSIPINYPPLL